jgi:hypothetical protein
VFPEGNLHGVQQLNDQQHEQQLIQNAHDLTDKIPVPQARNNMFESPSEKSKGTNGEHKTEAYVDNLLSQ